MTASPKRVLVVDDDPMYLELVERNLAAFGFNVTTSRSSLGVSNLIRRVQPDIVLIDVHIPALSGNALVELARRHAPDHTKFVLFSSADESKLRKIAAECGADGYLTKTADAATLATRLQAIAAAPA